MEITKIALEELLWTCECGNPMGADGIWPNKRWELVCSYCGPVGWVKIQLWSSEAFMTLEQKSPAKTTLSEEKVKE